MTDPRPVLGVSACLLREDKVLLILRGRAPYAGRLSLPGGRVEFGERLSEAVRREVLEETGLDVQSVFLRLHEAIGDGTHAVIAVHHAALPPDAAFVAGDDAAAAELVPVDGIEALEREGRTTPGLAAIVREAAEAHRTA